MSCRWCGLRLFANRWLHRLQRNEQIVGAGEIPGGGLAISNYNNVSSLGCRLLQMDASTHIQATQITCLNDYAPAYRSRQELDATFHRAFDMTADPLQVKRYKHRIAPAQHSLPVPFLPTLHSNCILSHYVERRAKDVQYLKAGATLPRIPDGTPISQQMAREVSVGIPYKRRRKDFVENCVGCPTPTDTKIPKCPC